MLVPTLLEDLQRHGWLRFDQFMARALYCPGSGYYEQKPDNPGRHGDYYTNVSVGPLFAELLAFQLANWLEPLAERAGTVFCVEAAAHDGRLAREVLKWFAAHRPDLSRRLRYLILEPSARRRSWQMATLQAWRHQVEWPGSPTEHCPANQDAWMPLSPQSIRGAIFSNELLDAFPVRRLCWNPRIGSWSEWGVGWDGHRFVWILLPDSPEAQQEREGLLDKFGIEVPPALRAVLPEGFTLDLSPSALDWWARAAQSLAEGWLLTFDYGLSAEEVLQPHRRAGTLRAYYRHHLAPDPLAQPGQQDLTAHVIFTGLRRTGEAAGLTTVLHEPQARFLVRVARQWAEAHQGRLPWDRARLRQFQTLVHPEHFGRAFQVFIQKRLAET
ncbi:MAG: SAM-dependent methyltransferase [Verrucomicrobiota bacterium]|nr:SAM-dependent methyltransferase [Limisphaera sp.]MDW8381112.1 SAM-dependent methyltransferase [Verrucomicrobiota bacterium]